MMAKALHKYTNGTENDDADILERLPRNPSETSDVSAKNSDDNLQLNYDGEEDAPKKGAKRRIQQFSDSDSDNEVQQNENGKSGSEKMEGSESDSDLATFKRLPHKSRILKLSNGSSSDSESSELDQAVKDTGSKKKSTHTQGNDTTNSTSVPLKSPILKNNKGSSSDSDPAVKNEQQQKRMKNKRNKMKDTFKSLMTSRRKVLSAGAVNESSKSASNSEDSNNEASSSIEKIKQKIKERMSFKPSICDPDTSDEENSEQKFVPKQKKERRTKLTSPKPQRMSAKQAMENMQKIKSESNRMLREKEVSLPYHRPKALSLKDIMSRRKPAVSSDGKSLPIKMNGEQLKQYAQMLDERQKQMMELWQSDTDEENDEKKSDNEEATAKTIDDKNPDSQIEAGAINEPNKNKLNASENIKEPNLDVSADNDELFDDLSQSIVKDTEDNESNENERNQESEETTVNIGDKVPDAQGLDTNIKLVLNDTETSITEEKNPDNNMLGEGVINNNEASTVSYKGAIQNNEASTGGNKGAIQNNEAKAISDKDTFQNKEASIVSDKNNEPKDSESAKTNTEGDSQLISLHYDSDELDNENLQRENELAKDVIGTKLDVNQKTSDEIENIDEEIEAMDVDNAFSDDDMNIEDIDNIIENAEIIRDIEDRANSQVLIRHRSLNLKPKLTGAPGTVIDLTDCDNLPKKSGMELLKERFTFFAKLKTPEELERDKERRIKPGNQHLKLKQELEQQMAEQRSLEWTKRLDDEKQQQKELKELRGEESDDDIDKMEAMLEDGNEENEAVSESEQELLENDIEMKDKPRVKNPMLENEADESDCDENEANDNGNEEIEQNEDDENEQENVELNDGSDENDDDESSDSESSESEEEQPTTKRGRILKAFEDSDDEDTKVAGKDISETKSVESMDLASQLVSQDDVLTLAQRHKLGSEDLFTSQSSDLLDSKLKSPSLSEVLVNDADMGTQTFSILDSTNNETTTLNGLDNVSVICETQAYDDNLDAVAAMCSGSFSQSLLPLPITQFSQSQTIGEDVLALCTGKFYENEFVSQVDDNHQMPLGASQDYDSCNDDSQNGDGDETQANAKQENPKNNKEVTNDIIIDTINKEVIDIAVKSNIDSKINNNKKVVDDNLKLILDELDDPEFDTPKPNKFFCGDKTTKVTEDLLNKDASQIRKKFIIDSDDDTNDVSETKKRKKFKKKKPENRALQISDDEEESEQEVEDYESDIEEKTEERLVEYDSEENEIEVKPQNQKPLKKKNKGTEFFEQEAELTSEDEWVGSGDEDEAGLDRMEREAGDDESFHQGQLQRELGQIHMRDVLDQDKREVRIIQELLFEDGDLGGGGRQRKFKWKNLDGDEETGAGGDELGDTQEEEFESEEQWRKQRHERETFLRQIQNNSDLDDSHNVSISRTAIIKANLMSKTMSMLLEENQPVTDKTNTVDTDKTDSPFVAEKKTKDIPSPKKPFSLLQQSYQGSILNRGRGALARLAALATPLAADDDAPKGKSAAPSNGRNFVFASLTPQAPKVTKRKAEANPSTPKLVKKMKTEDKQNISKSSLIDRMKL